MKSLLTSALAVGSALGFHAEHRVNCERERICNGNLMCAYVCKEGTVVTDTWADRALAYQRRLQRSERMVVTEFVATHNSAITEANGFAIEKYFISALLGGEDENQGDDIGTGTCQHITLIDQLRMGVRHLEIDVWWSPRADGGEDGDLIVCHSPVPLYPVGSINRAAAAANLTLDWDPKKMSCLGTQRGFVEVLQEIKDWMMLPENRDEILMLYFDNKNLKNLNERIYVQKGNADILSVFERRMIFAPADGNPMDHTLDALLHKGKRVIIENQRDVWSHPPVGDALVFYPAFWNPHQFGSADLQEFPNCTIQGDNAWYGKTWTRGLAATDVTEAATRCGVNLVSNDYTNPDDMKFYVWSWDQGEPRLPPKGTQYCAAMLPSGRWAALDCATPLPYACSNLPDGAETDAATARSQWYVDVNTVGAWKGADAPCPSGYTPSAPKNGFTNAVLNTASYGQTVWLNAPLAF